MRFLLAFFLCWARVSIVESTIVSKTTKIDDKCVLFCGSVVIFFDDASTECRSSLIVVGVGTAMSVTDYIGLGTAIANESKNSVVVIFDYNGNPVKLNPVTSNAKPFANALNKLIAQLMKESSMPVITSTILPPGAKLCVASQSPKIVLGGHSASGAAAFIGLQKNYYNFSVAGYLGLDPFPISIGSETQLVPSLNWGFSATTCAVKVSKAGRGAYDHSPEGHRVFYQLQNDNDKQKQCFKHCAFTDTGCPSCGLNCDSGAKSDLYHDVGVSVRLFLQAISEADDSKFSRLEFDSAFFLLDRSQFRLYIDDSTTAVNANEADAATKPAETVVL